MDPVTHTLIGAGMGQAFFKRRVGPEAVPILAFASNLPDIDGLVHLTSDPLAITWRRSFGHSIFVLPLWALALAWLFKRKYPNQTFRTLYGLCLLGAGVHVFFDLVNSFGVRIVWPFGAWRPELAILFIIDLILTGLLAAPYLVLLWKPWREKLEPACRLSMAAVLFYVCFCETNRILASRALNGAAAREGLHPEFSYVFPEPLGPHRWRGLVLEKNLYHVYLIKSLRGEIEPMGTVKTEPGDPRVERARKTPDGERLEAFFKAPVWSARESSAGIEVSAYDLRFRPIVINRGGLFEFVFRLRPDGSVEKARRAP